MAFVRKSKFLGPIPNEKTLTERMNGIGMAFGGDIEVDAEIEQTLVHASMVGLDERDYRVLRALCAWIEIHSARLNIDRLFLTLQQCESDLVSCFWSAISSGLRKSDPRFRKIRKLYDGPPLSILGDSTEFQVSRHGHDERFDAELFLVPSNLIPFRDGDVLKPDAMVKRSRTYFWRTLIGPTWRADAWAYLEKHPDASAATTAGAVGCSYSAGWKYVQDFRLCHRNLQYERLAV